MTTQPTPGALLPHAHPPAGFRLVTQVVVDAAEHLHLLRVALAVRLEEEGFAAGNTMASVTNRLVLVASELATNALCHGRPPTTVRLSRRGSSLLLEVEDHDPRSGPAYSGTRLLGHGGLGLYLAQRLSLDVGWCTGQATKTVWATLA